MRQALAADATPTTGILCAPAENRYQSLMSALLDRRILGFGLALVLVLSVPTLVQADPPKVYAYVTSAVGDTPRSTLPANTAKVWIIFETKGAKRGDKLRAVLIADHAGHIAPENSRITEGKSTLDGDTPEGGISFSKPTNDWPLGEYHVEIYVNDELATSVKFTIEAAR